MVKKVHKEISDYLKQIGARGGKKSKRVLTPEQAKKMVEAREAKRNNLQSFVADCVRAGLQVDDDGYALRISKKGAPRLDIYRTPTGKFWKAFRTDVSANARLVIRSLKTCREILGL